MTVCDERTPLVAPHDAHAVRAVGLGRWAAVLLVCDRFRQFAALTALPVPTAIEQRLQVACREGNVGPCQLVLPPPNAEPANC